MDPIWGSVISATAGLVGVIVGASATTGIAAHLRKKRRVGHWRAMLGEIEHAQWQAEAYISAGVMAPAYRLPTTCYQNGLPLLLEDAVLGTNDTRALMRYYDLIDQMNRTLEQAQRHAEGIGTNELAQGLLEREAERVELKAQSLANKDDASDFQRVCGMIHRQLKKEGAT